MFWKQLCYGSYVIMVPTWTPGEVAYLLFYLHFSILSIFKFHKSDSSETRSIFHDCDSASLLDISVEMNSYYFVQ